MLKHAGHATVANVELQCSHRVESDDAAAPQFGQFNDWAAMAKKISVRRSFCKRRSEVFCVVARIAKSLLCRRSKDVG